MAVIGIGLDLVEIARIERLLALHEQSFLQRTFTAAEQKYCHAAVRPCIHYAARFAAKEAAAKALGTGFAEGVSWLDIEVLREESGQPQLCLHNMAALIAHRLGVGRMFLSLTHTQEHAMAQVLLESL